MSACHQTVDDVHRWASRCQSLLLDFHAHHREPRVVGAYMLTKLFGVSSVRCVQLLQNRRRLQRYQQMVIDGPFTAAQRKPLFFPKQSIAMFTPWCATANIHQVLEIETIAIQKGLYSMQKPSICLSVYQRYHQCNIRK